MNIKIKLHAKQEQAFFSPARFIVTRTGIQGGKTFLGSAWLINEIYRLYDKGKKGDFLIAAPTVKVLKQSTLKKFRPMFPSDWGVWMEQDKAFKLNWKNDDGEDCFIYIRSTDDPDLLEGMTLLAAWLDEAGKMKAEVWVNVQGRLSINLGRCMMTTTPYGVNWVWKDVCRKARKGVKEYAEFQWASIDNPYFPKEEYYRMKEILPEATFLRRYCGEFKRPEGLVYPDYNETDHVIEPFAIPDTWERFSGLDFGHRDPTCGLAICKDPNTKIFYVFDEFYQRKPLLSKIADFLNKHFFRYILADWSSAQVIQELKRMYQVKNLYNADKKAGSFDITYERITLLLKEKRLKFFRWKARNTIDEIESYHHKDEDDDTPTSDKPVDIDNHAMDALRYAFSKQVKSIYKPRPYINRSQRISRKVANQQVDPWTGYPI